MKKFNLLSGSYSHLFCFCLIAISLFPKMIQAQNGIDGNKKPYSWLSAGLGASSFGVSLGAGYSNQIGKSLLVSGRLIHNTELSMFVTPAETIWDIGLLSGPSIKMSRGFATLSAGISIVSGVKRGKLIKSEWFSSEYEKVHFSTFGIPLEGQLFLAASQKFGIGIYLFADINTEKSFYGALIGIRYGHLR